MNSPDPVPQAPAAPAIPWYQSPVQIAQIVSLCAGLAMFFPKLANALGWTDDAAIRAWVNSVMGAVGILVTLVGVIASVFGIHARARSPIQPLKLNQARADTHNAAAAPDAPLEPGSSL